MTGKRSYKELKQLKTFEERYNYLKLSGEVGDPTFGGSRYLNQQLYTSPEWAEIRNKVIIRDEACDLGIEGKDISGNILVHHLNPITKEQILNRDPAIFDMDNLIATSFKTHNGIHYGKGYNEDDICVERKPGDTCPWKHSK